MNKRKERHPIEEILDDMSVSPVNPVDQVIRQYFAQKYRTVLSDKGLYNDKHIPHFSNWQQENLLNHLMLKIDSWEVEDTKWKPEALINETKYEQRQTKKTYKSIIFKLYSDNERDLINYWRSILECIKNSPIYRLIDIYYNLQIRILKSEQIEIPYLFSQYDIDQQKPPVKEFYKCVTAFARKKEILNCPEDFFMEVETNMAKKQPIKFEWKVKSELGDKSIIIDGDFINIQAGLLFSKNVRNLYDTAMKLRRTEKRYKYDAVKKVIEELFIDSEQGELGDREDGYTQYLIEKMTGRNMCICMAYYYNQILSRISNNRAKYIEKQLDYIVRKLVVLKNVLVRPQIIKELFEPVIYFINDVNIEEVLNVIGSDLSKISENFNDKNIDVLDMDIGTCEEYCEKIQKKISRVDLEWKFDIDAYILDTKEWNSYYKHIQKIIFYYIIK